MSSRYNELVGECDSTWVASLLKAIDAESSVAASAKVEARLQDARSKDYLEVAIATSRAPEERMAAWAESSRAMALHDKFMADAAKAMARAEVLRQLIASSEVV